MLQTPEGAIFLGSTPELLYKRCGSRVASEAVAATRPRGPPGETDPLHLDSLRSSCPLTYVILFGLLILGPAEDSAAVQAP